MISSLKTAARESGCRDLTGLGETIDGAIAGGRPVIDEILNSGLVREEDFLRHLAAGLGLEWADDLSTGPEERPKLQRLCSAGTALRHRFLPFGFSNGGGDAPVSSRAPEKVKLAFYDPMDLIARQAAIRTLDLPIRWCLTSRKRLLSELQTFYGVGAETFEEILEGREVDLGAFEMADEANVIDEADEEASVVKFVNQIIRDALSQRATDIHIEPMAELLRIRYRIDGVLRDVPVPERIKSLQSSVIARIKVMAHLDIAERRLPQDGRINLSLGGQSIDVRVATIPSVEGESLSLRLLGQESFTLEKLQLLPGQRSHIDRLLRQPNGIVLVTGPTGCGKSTTLYTFLSSINRPDLRIVTIEDPVEHKLPGVVQIAVKPEIDLTFASGLRSILRGDPNVIMVGEIRDLETAEIAIRSALTGHLVFSTLHTNDALGGITRLIDMGVEPFLVSASVQAFIAQRLVRRLCPHCRQPADISTNYLDSIGLETPPGTTLYEPSPEGCEACHGRGYLGRLAIYEICPLSQKVQDLIVARAGSREIRDQVEAEGFQTMREYGFRKVIEGETTIEEVVSVTGGSEAESGEH